MNTTTENVSEKHWRNVKISSHNPHVETLYELQFVENCSGVVGSLLQGKSVLINQSPPFSL